MSKTVLVTGASRGIGRAVAVAFAQSGYNVAVNYNKSQEKAMALKSELTNSGTAAEKILLVQANLEETAEIEKMVGQTVEHFGSIDVLVNNAAVWFGNLVTDITETDWDKIFNVNVKAVFTACKLVLPQMINRKNGRIINISSMWGQVGSSCETAYSATKGAVDAFTKALALETGPSGITVNAVSPGFIDTDMNSCLGREETEAIINETPLCRIGKPKDVADAVLFLASDKADFITGQILPVNGGLVTTA